MKALSILIFCILPLSAFAFQFEISPQPDGSITSTVAFDWNYGRSPVFSGLRGDYSTSVSDDSQPASYVATSGKTLSVEADILGWRGDWAASRLSLSANCKYDHMTIREIGYIDQGASRYFVLNDRTIDIYLPRAKLAGSLALGALAFELSGEYSPWYQVDLAQQLTVSPVFPKTSHASSQSAMNALSFDGDVAFGIPGFKPIIGFGYDRVPIAYSALTATGLADFDTLIETLRFKATLELGFLKIGALVPAVLAQYEKTTTTDYVSHQSIADDGKWTFGFGLH